MKKMNDKIREIYFNPDMTDNEKVKAITNLKIPFIATYRGVDIKKLDVVYRILLEKNIDIDKLCDGIMYGFNKAREMQEKAMQQIINDILKRSNTE